MPPPLGLSGGWPPEFTSMDLGLHMLSPSERERERFILAQKEKKLVLIFYSYNSHYNPSMYYNSIYSGGFFILFL